MEHTQADKFRALRGQVLVLLYENHRKQYSRLRLVQLAGALDRLHFDVSLNELATVMQDLKERSCVDFVQERDRYSGRVTIASIQITPRGRDLVEGTVSDAAVSFD